MDRRQFTKGLAALGAAPLVPATALASTAAPATAAANFTPFMFAQSSNFARMFGVCSPEMLVDEFSIPTGVADAITTRLIRRGTLSVPNALGVSRFVEPVRATATTTATAQSARTQVVRSTDASGKTTKLASEKAHDLLDHDSEPEDATTEFTSDTAIAPADKAILSDSEGVDTRIPETAPAIRKT